MSAVAFMSTEQCVVIMCVAYFDKERKSTSQIRQIVDRGAAWLYMHTHTHTSTADGHCVS